MKSRGGNARRVLTSLGVLWVVTSLWWMAPVAAQQTRTLRFGHIQSAEHANHKGAMRAAEVIAAKSGGRLKLEIFPAGQLGKGQDMVQQASEGNLDFGIDGAGLYSQWDKRMSIFEAPYLSRDYDHFKKIWGSPFAQQLATDFRNKQRVRLFGGVWYYGTRQMTTKDRPINTLADLKGLKLRVPEIPVYLDFARALGASPTPMAIPEIYLALQTGTVQGQENPLPTIFANKWYEAQKYINLTSHVVLGLFPYVSEKTWLSLSEADRKLVEEAFEEGGKVNDEVTFKQEAELLEFFKQKGLVIVRPDLVPFRAAMGPLYKKYEDIWGKGVFEQFSAIK